MLAQKRCASARVQQWRRIVGELSCAAVVGNTTRYQARAIYATQRGMSQSLQLQCRCGGFRGVVTRVSPQLCNRVVCFCDDCQAYVRWLRRTDLLDRWGGTALSQMPPAHVQITQGADALRCVRLSEKGMHRWYAGCCRSPFGNTLGPGWPFIGLFEANLDPAISEEQRFARLGPVTYVYGKFAVGEVPPQAEDTASLRTLANTARKMATWWLRGLAKPSPVFDGRKPRAIAEVLTSVERKELAQAFRSTAA